MLIHTVSTSPYIYARFKQIAAGDLCGKRSIYETMLSFTPGELSTIAGPLYNPSYSGLGDPNWATQPFNIGDLPCPPQSIMVCVTPPSILLHV